MEYSEDSRGGRRTNDPLNGIPGSGFIISSVTERTLAQQFRSLGLNEEDEDGCKGSLDEGGPDGEEAYPLRPYAEDCAYYLRTGHCKFKLACKFNHPPLMRGGRDEREIEGEASSEKTNAITCKYYFTAGGCKYGNVCRYSHSEDNTEMNMNFLGLPIRPGERKCPFYMRTGSCAYGTACRYDHPDPTAVEESGSYGLTYNSESAMINLIGGAVVSVDNRHGFQVKVFPERPGEPECTHFMRTGDCKFHSACRFHHPVNRISKSPSGISTKGLPLRPGRDVCRYYARDGTCNYGLACLFDHPVNYGSNSANL